jgi:hypothetical protein
MYFLTRAPPSPSHEMQMLPDARLVVETWRSQHDFNGPSAYGWYLDLHHLFLKAIIALATAQDA